MRGLTDLTVQISDITFCMMRMIEYLAKINGSSARTGERIIRMAKQMLMQGNASHTVASTEGQLGLYGFGC